MINWEIYPIQSHSFYELFSIKLHKSKSSELHTWIIKTKSLTKSASLLTWHLFLFWSASEFYEPGAFMLEEEGTVIAGLLVGLNVLDCNICIKGEDLDQPVSKIILIIIQYCFLWMNRFYSWPCFIFFFVWCVCVCGGEDLFILWDVLIVILHICLHISSCWCFKLGIIK